MRETDASSVVDCVDKEDLARLHRLSELGCHTVARSGTLR